MTALMPFSCDAAVSTDDNNLCVTEVQARCEAVLAILVENKVESIKASCNSATTANRKKSDSAPASPRRRARLASNSTQSTSQNQHHHSKHHHQRLRHERHRHRKTSRIGDCNQCQRYLHHKHRRHCSAPSAGTCDGKESSEKGFVSAESPCKRQRHSRSPQELHAAQLFPGDIEQDIALINFAKAQDASGDFSDNSKTHRSAYFSQNSAQLKIHYDEDDYVTLNVATDYEDEEDFISRRDKRAFYHDRYHHHRPRRKRKKRRRKVEIEEEVARVVDPEELPPRARWTIMATACILLTMSLLLVGVTLRMAPVIDEMASGPLGVANKLHVEIKKRNSRRGSSVNRRTSQRRKSTTRRKDSVRPMKDRMAKSPTEPPKTQREIEQARRHQRVAMIVVGTFFFILAASVLVVIVTLTQSSFHSPVIANKELRAHLRKENEELLSQLNRDFSMELENVTAAL